MLKIHRSCASPHNLCQSTNYPSYYGWLSHVDLANLIVLDATLPLGLFRSRLATRHDQRPYLSSSWHRLTACRFAAVHCLPSCSSGLCIIHLVRFDASHTLSSWKSPKQASRRRVDVLVCEDLVGSPLVEEIVLQDMFRSCTLQRHPCCFRTLDVLVMY